MSAERLGSWTTAIGLVLGVGYVLAGLLGWILDAAEGSDLAVWLVLLLGGGALLLASLLVPSLPRGAALALGIVGALAGAIALFWSILVPLLAIAFVVLLVMSFRRGDAPAAA